MSDRIECEALRQLLSRMDAAERELTAAEADHLDGCEACLEAWLDATVTLALDVKPKMQVPADFAVRVAAQIPPKRSRPYAFGIRIRHWGLLTASLLVVIGLFLPVITDPAGMNSRLGTIFVAIVVTEIAGIALWLGPRGV